MGIRVADNPTEERYEVYSDDRLAGFTEYRLGEGFIAFVHTEIKPEFEGQGMGGALIRDTLDDVRSRGLAVLPYCPFVRGYIDKHREEYLDLVPVENRPEFGL